MKYFHRTSAAPDAVIASAAVFFGGRLTPTGELSRRRTFAGSLGTISIDVMAEGGHYTLVNVATDQPAESELDRLAKRFLGEVYRLAKPSHELRGSY